MRRLTILAARFGLLDPLLQAAAPNPGLHQALFDAVSAHRPYRAVICGGPLDDAHPRSRGCADARRRLRMGGLSRW
ncbi:MAG TPA: hypothetical protein DEP84_02325 [Chloroflexi bacterium]|nr:hypothetical protein [Chloroflexota bacterium]